MHLYSPLFKVVGSSFTEQCLDKCRFNRLNSVDPDQTASQQSDQRLHSFPFALHLLIVTDVLDCSNFKIVMNAQGVKF